MKDKTKVGLITGSIILLLLGYIAYDAGMFGVPATIPGVPTTVPAAGVACAGIQAPDDLVATTGINFRNGLNTASAEFVAVEFYIYELLESGESYVTSSATGPTSTFNDTDLKWGSSYVIKFLPTDGASGDSAYLTSTNRGSIIDGNLYTGPLCGDYDFELIGKQHATLQWRFFDGAMTARYPDSGYSTSWNTTKNITAGSTSQYGAAEAVSSDGEYEIFVWTKSQQTDTDFCDSGCLLLFDINTSDWSSLGPDVSVDGVALTENKAGLLTPDEALEFNAYEFAYKFPGSIEDVPKREIYVSFKSATGVDPDEVIGMMIVSRTNYKTLDGTTIANAAVRDDATHELIYGGAGVVFSIS